MATRTRDTAALRTRRKAELLGKFLHAVERLDLQGVGFGEASVETLIGEAGVSRATFYSYFRDKNDLLRELAESSLTEMLDLWLENLPGGASKQQLSAAFDLIIAAYLSRRAVMVAAGESPPGSEMAREFEALIVRSADAFARQIRTAQAEGRVPTDIDARTTALLLSWMCERGLARLTPDSSPDQRDMLAACLTEVYWRTLRGKA